MTTIAVTGASGHLGSALITELLADSTNIIRAQYYSQRPPIKHDRLVWVKGDLTPSDLATLIDGVNFVIHCAAIISINGDKNGNVYKTNVTGTQHVVNACINDKVDRLIHISSTHALQEVPLTTEFNESRPYKTKNDFAYDYTKAKAEQLVIEANKAQNLDTVIIRPSSMIGPVDYKPSLLGEAIIDISKGKIPAVVKGGYDFIDVRDVAKSIANSLVKGRSGTSYNLTGKYYTIKEIARITSEIAKVPAPKVTVPNWIIMASIPFINIQSKINKKPPKFTKESITVLKFGHPNMSSSKAKNELNHSARDIKSTIKDLLEWSNNIPIK